MFSADWWESRCHLWKNSKPNDRQNPSVMAEFLGPSRLFFFRQGASRLTTARRCAQRKRVSARLVPDSIESLVHVLTTANFSPHVVYLYAGRIHCGKTKTNPSSVSKQKSDWIIKPVVGQHFPLTRTENLTGNRVHK